LSDREISWKDIYKQVQGWRFKRLYCSLHKSVNRIGLKARENEDLGLDIYAVLCKKPWKCPPDCWNLPRASRTNPQAFFFSLLTPLSSLISPFSLSIFVPFVFIFVDKLFRLYRF
jgi:hypothetical protein